MTKAEFAATVKEGLTGLEITKADAESFVAATVETIASLLQKDKKVSIAGLGTFRISSRQARVGRNPKTGESVQIPAKDTIKFKADKKFCAAAEVA